MSSNTWIVLSDYRWKALLKVTCLPNSSCNFRQNLEVNWVPQSDMIERVLHATSVSLSHTLYPLFNIIFYSYRNKMGWLSQSINHYTSRIKPSQDLRKTNHKVHDYSFPLPFWSWHTLKQTCRTLMFILQLLTIWHFDTNSMMSFIMPDNQ